MAKLRPDPITATDLTEYLEESDDFQLELDVFHMCQAGGHFQVEFGGTYRDCVTGKDRQFDIRARQTQGICTLKLAIECKNLKTNFPLLVSQVPRRPEESFHQVILTKAANHSSPRETHNLRSLYPSTEPVGKSTAQVGRALNGELSSSDSEVFDKWAQAISSASDLVSESADDYRRVPGKLAATVVIPVLVVADETLWTVEYSDDGSRLGEPSPSEECTIYLGKCFTEHAYKISHLHVFTKTRFGSFLERITMYQLNWETIFPRSLNRLLADFEIDDDPFADD